MKYRPEVDGLRAIAVTSVIIFHSGLELLHGGYIGVDVFFVISGYLITYIIDSELVAGRFGILRFYERRARRILPALTLVVVATMPFSWWLMTPLQLIDYSQSLISVATFSSNILFWLEADYFAPASELKPLLHTWSLSVEEQFYMIFPLVLMINARIVRLNSLFLVLVLACISFIACQFIFNMYFSANFYLPITRAWELFIGSSVALILRYHKVSASGFFSGLGVVLIVYSVVFFDDNTPVPSVYTLLPVIGTALILIYCDGSTFIGRLLGSRPLVSVGLISYSAYLWHQPIFSYARLLPNHTKSYLVWLGLILLTFILSYVSWAFVEKPFRKIYSSDRRWILQSIVALALIGILGLVGVYYKGFPSRLNPLQKEILSWQNYPKSEKFREGECFFKPSQFSGRFGSSCYGDDSIAIWGDSHAAALASGFRTVLTNVAQFTIAACPPILNVDFTNAPKCRNANNESILEIIEHDYEVVILHANWRAYDLGSVQSLVKTIHYLKESGVKRVILLGAVPIFPPSLPEVLIGEKARLDRDHWSQVTDLNLGNTDHLLKEISAKSEAAFFPLAQVFCSGNLCRTLVDYKGKYQPIIFDAGHLTEAGAVWAVRQLYAMPTFADIVK